MKFIEVVDGFSIRVDAISSIKRTKENRVIIETENREYEVVADFVSLMGALDEEEKKRRDADKFSTQYFGG